jgi:signal transduction histidine kinase
LQQSLKTLESYLTLTHRRTLENAPVSLSALAQELRESRYADAFNQGLLEMVVADVVPPVAGDKELLKMILEALIDNALEALPNSGGRARLVLETAPGGAAVIATVSDTGAGITPGQRDRLFQPFSSTKSGHRGLGLARARRYAEWHRGELGLVESAPGKTIFRWETPL